MSKKSFLAKTLTVIGAVAAIGGVCYIFRDKIKASKVYNDLDVDDKINKAKSFITDKMPCCNDDYEDDFFYDDDEDEDIKPSNSSAKRGYTSLDNSTKEDVASTDTSNEDTSIPTISFEDMTEINDNTDETPISYENEGLSDVSEDPDVLEYQDKLDF